MKQCECGSYALNEHPESGLCDRCWWKKQAEEQLSLVAKWLAVTSPVVHELFLKEFDVVKK